jgi:hypothetical protein
MKSLKFRLSVAIFMVFLSGTVIPTSSQAESNQVDQTDTTWGTIVNDDGFSRTLSIYKDADNFGTTDLGDDITYTIELQCTKKKLSILIYGNPIGIFPATSFGAIDGYALSKVDTGKIVKFPYIAMKDSSGIILTTPKTLTTAILKGKNSFSFKIPSSVQNNTVANFTIGDLSSYVAKFKNLGCPLK